MYEHLLFVFLFACACVLLKNRLNPPAHVTTLFEFVLSEPILPLHAPVGLAVVVVLYKTGFYPVGDEGPPPPPPHRPKCSSSPPPPKKKDL